MQLAIPPTVRRNLDRHPEGRAWLTRLPALVDDAAARWSLTLGTPFDTEATCSFVAPCTREDGSSAVLKIGYPHMEALHEIDALAAWSGDATVRLLDADREANAMLLERCVPGTTMRSLVEADQDVVIAGLLTRLWQTPVSTLSFRPLTEMIDHWMTSSRANADRWPDRQLAEEGLSVFAELLAGEHEQALLATDLHAGNVLRAERLPWLVIDPKPFVGDPCYDATQHLLNCKARLRYDAGATIASFADLLGVDAERVRLWTFARLAAEWGDQMSDNQKLAKHIA